MFLLHSMPYFTILSITEDKLIKGKNVENNKVSIEITIQILV
jgi:hypothetical protein